MQLKVSGLAHGGHSRTRVVAVEQEVAVVCPAEGQHQLFWQSRWKVKTVREVLPDHMFCSRRDPLLSLRRNCSDWRKGKEWEVGTQRDLKEVFSAVCPRVWPMDFSEPPAGGYVFWAMGTPSVLGSKHTFLPTLLPPF